MNLVSTSVVLVAVLAVALLGQGVQAGFECEKHWAGPSQDNNIADCKLQELYLSRYIRLVSFAIPILFLLWVILCYPLAFCFRQNPCCKCCGSNRRRPGNCCCGGSEWDDQPAEIKEEQYGYGEVQRTKCCSGILWLLGMVCLCLMILGSSMMGDAYNSFWTEMYGLVDWAETQVGNVRSTVTVANNTLMPGVPESAFTSALNQTQELRQNLTKMEADANVIVEQVALVAFGVGVFPVVLLVLGTLFAVCDIRTCGPACLTCCYALFIIIYAIIAVIFMVIAMITDDICDEIDLFTLHEPPKPGIFKWWIEPTCNATVDLEQIKADVADAEVSNSQRGCTEFTSICSTAPVWSVSNPRKIYYCGIEDANRDCRNYTSFNNIYLNSYPKAGLPTLCASMPNNLCVPANCSKDCIDVDNRQQSDTVFIYLDYAARALKAFYDYILPLVSCSNLLKRALQTFSACRMLAKALLLMGCGATCYAFIFCVGICNQMRGQKRFFKKKDPDAVVEEEDEFDALNMASEAPKKEGRPRSHSRGKSPGRPRSPGGSRPNSPGGSNEPYGRPQKSPERSPRNV